MALARFSDLLLVCDEIQEDGLNSPRNAPEAQNVREPELVCSLEDPGNLVVTSEGKHTLWESRLKKGS